MKTRVVSVTEFKAKCLALLDEVDTEGAVLTITKRGRAVARVARPPRKPAYPKLGGALEGLMPVDFDDMRDLSQEWEVIRDPERVLNPDRS